MSQVRLLCAPMLVGVGLCAISLACTSGAAPPTPAPTADAFAVVRATSQAAYVEGKSLLDRGQFSGCELIDTAKTTDPDDRADIQQALDRCLAAIAQTMTALPTSTTTTAVQQRTIVIATLPPPAATPTPAAAGSNATPPAAVPAAPAQLTETAGVSLTLVPWNDPQGRFSIAAPADWAKIERPQALVGNGVVQFRDSNGRATVDVSVDTSTRAVSPELYAASMEITMQQQMPGYASEQMQPGSTAGNPSVRRVFTFTQRDATGQDHQARGFQVTLVKGSTPYIIEGSAPADQYQQYSATFDRVIESFRFS